MAVSTNRQGSLPAKIQILANHFLLKFNPSMVILQYKVTTKEPMKYKGEASIVTAELLPAHLGAYPVASDGHNNIYSKVDLPETPFQVAVGSNDGRHPKTYTVTVQKVNDLHLSLVDDYIQGRRGEVPREVLQAMDVVVRENLRRSTVLVGKFFHSKDDDKQKTLGKGVTVSWGLQQSLKLIAQGLILCLDYSVIPFIKPLLLLDFLQQIGVDPRDKERVTRALNGVKVTVSHRQTNQKYVLRGLTEQADGSIAFPAVDANGVATGKKVRLVEYFKKRYNKVVRCEIFSCLELGTKDKKNDVPMEFCMVAAWQKCTEELWDRNMDRAWKEHALAKPDKRQSKISEMDNSEDGPCGGRIINIFDISIDTEMTRLDGRVLNVPVLKVRNDVAQVCRNYPKENGQWSFHNKKLFEVTKIDNWPVADFSSRGEQSFGLELDHFIYNLVKTSAQMGISMRNVPLFTEIPGLEILEQPENLSAFFRKILVQSQGKLQILICLVPDRCNGFKTLKRVAEIELGIITQCCVKKSALDDNNHLYLANVVLKMNAKLGGATAALYTDLPSLKTSDRVMFIGADVNHPKSFDSASHSIAAVVGTINWPGACKYAPRFRIQPNRKEQILNLGEMCLELINLYAKVNGFKPEKIFLFRDGVADNQFEMVQNEELADVKNAICTGSYKPTITLIVAQKRHQTRLFPVTSTGNVVGNVPAGTVAETSIVNKDRENFYLCSYNGILGTSKTTHYQVLEDNNKFAPGQIMEILYSLCYMFARCTKPVSLVPPVFWADVMAYRARLYYESFQESKSRCSSSTASESDEISRFLRLHCNVKDKMFFI